MKGDFTRDTFDPSKHFNRVLMQQGRVQLDADWNEEGEILAHRIETETIDVVGRCGGPDGNAAFHVSASIAGFVIKDVSGLGIDKAAESAAELKKPIFQPDPGDFYLSAGRYYVDGILCENEHDVLFTGQPDYFRGLDAHTVKPHSDAGRYLVYLDVWKRHITALDDPGIREVALGGPDTATRIKTVWQVKCVRIGDKGEDLDCACDLDAWNKITAPVTAGLKARAAVVVDPGKPCIVPPGAGYRRLENQLYRVEIHNEGTIPGSASVKAPTFKWSRDNGSVVSGIASINSGIIALTGVTSDSELSFSPGQWIEYVDDSYELLNIPGPMAKILSIDDLDITIDIPNAIGTWPGALSAAQQKLHPKIRRWDSNGVITATVPAGNDGYMDLEDGVQVHFASNAAYKTGDYWLIPARTDTADVEWPQSNNLPEFREPHGIRHHYCKLAVIDFTGKKIVLAHDCRRLFPPLTELSKTGSCCTLTVGDGRQTFGDYTSIQQAVNHLPAKGGRICVLPGTYAENVVIENRDNIQITGCRHQSLLKTHHTANGDENLPLILIKDSTRITVFSLAFEAAQNAPAILVEQSVDSARKNFWPMLYKAGLRDITLSELIINGHKRSAIEVRGAEGVRITSCRITMSDIDGLWPGIFFLGTDGVIEHNEISLGTSRILPLKTDSSAMGKISGIQLGGQSARVRIAENKIENVNGQGITLGSLRAVDDQEIDIPIYIIAPFKEDDPCTPRMIAYTYIPAYIQWTPKVRATFRSAGSLSDISIVRNTIQNTGMDGIGVAGYFDLSEADEFITVEGLEIIGNEITGCLSRTLLNIRPAMAASMAYGGVALADVDRLVIRENVIEGNGADQDKPVCGVFVLHGEGIDITHNRIMKNGKKPAAKTPPSSFAGATGGIVIGYALAPTELPAETTPGAPAANEITNKLIENYSAYSIPEPTGFPALNVHGNIVHAPVGPALSAIALGPVSVVGNQFTSGALAPREGLGLLLPSTVSLFNLGMSNEFYLQYFQFRSVWKHANKEAPALKGLDDMRSGSALANGNILFANNQCSLDLLESGSSFAFSSIGLFTLDDVAFYNNQCDCNLMVLQDFIFSQALVFGASVRVNGNRFKEGMWSAPLSAITVGFLNSTVHNQATHCLLVHGSTHLVQASPNTILVNYFMENFCGTVLETILRKFFGRNTGAAQKLESLNFSYEILPREFEANIMNMDVARSEGLASVAKFRSVKTAQTSRLSDRLAVDLGSENPEVVVLKRQIVVNQTQVRTYSAEAAQAKMEAQAVTAKDWQLEGFVRDAARNPLPGWTVALYDETGRRADAFTTATTDDNGYYRLHLAQSSDVAKVYPYVFDANGKLLHRETDPVAVTLGESRFLELIIDESSVIQLPPEVVVKNDVVVTNVVTPVVAKVAAPKSQDETTAAAKPAPTKPGGKKPKK